MIDYDRLLNAIELIEERERDNVQLMMDFKAELKKTNNKNQNANMKVHESDGLLLFIVALRDADRFMEEQAKAYGNDIVREYFRGKADRCEHIIRLLTSSPT